MGGPKDGRPAGRHGRFIARAPADAKAALCLNLQPFSMARAMDDAFDDERPLAPAMKDEVSPMNRDADVRTIFLAEGVGIGLIRDPRAMFPKLAHEK